MFDVEVGLGLKNILVEFQPTHAFAGFDLVALGGGIDQFFDPTLEVIVRILHAIDDVADARTL